MSSTCSLSPMYQCFFPTALWPPITGTLGQKCLTKQQKKGDQKPGYLYNRQGRWLSFLRAEGFHPTPPSFLHFFLLLRMVLEKSKNMICWFVSPSHSKKMKFSYFGISLFIASVWASTVNKEESNLEWRLQIVCYDVRHNNNVLHLASYDFIYAMCVNKNAVLTSKLWLTNKCVYWTTIEGNFNICKTVTFE